MITSVTLDLLSHQITIPSIFGGNDLPDWKYFVTRLHLNFLVLRKNLFDCHLINIFKYSTPWVSDDWWNFLSCSVYPLKLTRYNNLTEGYIKMSNIVWIWYLNVKWMSVHVTDSKCKKFDEEPYINIEISQINDPEYTMQCSIYWYKYSKLRSRRADEYPLNFKYNSWFLCWQTLIFWFIQIFFLSKGKYFLLNLSI